MDGWIDERKDRWTDGKMDDEWMDRWIDSYIIMIY